MACFICEGCGEEQDTKYQSKVDGDYCVDCMGDVRPIPEIWAQANDPGLRCTCEDAPCCGCCG
jgi:hypothetical protein